MTDRAPDSDRVAMVPNRTQRWLDRRLTQLGVGGWFGRDVALAVAVTMVSLVAVAALLPLIAHEQGEPVATARAWWLIAAVTGQSLALCLRRARPPLCLAVVVACQLIIFFAVPEGSVRLLAPLVVAYTIATLATVPRTAAMVGAAVLVESLTAVVLAMPPSTEGLGAVANQVGSSVLSYLVAAFLGVFVATRRRYRQMVWAQAAEQERARLRAAVTAERSQIARELHDVAAHHLSGMVVQAAAVERLVDRDPAAARDGAAWLRRQGKETLDNLRQVVGLLRERTDAAAAGLATAPPGAADHAPVPGLAALGQLVDTARALGAEVDLQQRGSAIPLPPLADISFYRVAQQSLTNARQHAPGSPVKIVLGYGDRRVTLEVENGPAAASVEPAETSSGGTGLAGMRERAGLVGAELTAGPTDAGGWRVTLMVPVTNIGRSDTPADSAATTGGSHP